MAADDWYEHKRGLDGEGLENWNDPSWEQGHKERQSRLALERRQEYEANQQAARGAHNSRTGSWGGGGSVAGGAGAGGGIFALLLLGLGVVSSLPLLGGPTP
jgi:hypothetical protein